MYELRRAALRRVAGVSRKIGGKSEPGQATAEAADMVPAALAPGKETRRVLLTGVKKTLCGERGGLETRCIAAQGRREPGA